MTRSDSLPNDPVRDTKVNEFKKEILKIIWANRKEGISGRKIALKLLEDGSTMQKDSLIAKVSRYNVAMEKEGLIMRKDKDKNAPRLAKICFPVKK